jgi:hypothetical protein
MKYTTCSSGTWIVTAADSKCVVRSTLASHAYIPGHGKGWMKSAMNSSWTSVQVLGEWKYRRDGISRFLQLSNSCEQYCQQVPLSMGFLDNFAPLDKHLHLMHTFSFLPLSYSCQPLASSTIFPRHGLPQQFCPWGKHLHLVHTFQVMGKVGWKVRWRFHGLRCKSSASENTEATGFLVCQQYWLPHWQLLPSYGLPRQLCPW